MPHSWKLFPCWLVSKSIFLMPSCPWGLSFQPCWVAVSHPSVSTLLEVGARPEECCVCELPVLRARRIRSLVLMTCLPQYRFGRAPLLSSSVWQKNWMSKCWNTQCCAWVPGCQKPVRITETVARMVIKNNEINVLNCSFFVLRELLPLVTSSLLKGPVSNL